MTYNTEFLWDGIEPEDGSSRVEFPWRGDAEAAQQHMNAVAEVIHRQNPDILVLQEVEDEAALDHLNAMLEGLDYSAHFVQGRDTFTGQDVALLTRIEPTSASRVEGEGESGGEQSQVTKNLVATFELPDGAKLAVISAHLIARPTDASRRLKREAQADALRDAAVELQRDGYLVVIAGDLNDYDVDVPDAAEEEDPISDTLAILKPMDPATQADDLVNALGRVPRVERRTSWWDRDDSGTISSRDLFTAIDHVLLSPELAVRIEQVNIPRHDVTQVGDHLPMVVRLSAGD